MAGNTNGISPCYLGDTSPVWQCTMIDDNGNAFPLTGLDPTTAFTMHWKNTINGVVRAGNGTWAFPSTPGAATLGLINYTLGSVDVNTAGIHKVYPIVTTVNGNQHFDAQIVEVIALA